MEIACNTWSVITELPRFVLGNSMNIRVGGKPVASIADAAPMTNITPCGMCTSMANPAVAAATAAALGVLTPQPCVPVPAGTWVCPGTIRVGGKPILTSDGKQMVIYKHAISTIIPERPVPLYPQGEAE